MASLSASGLVPISAAIAGSEVAMTVESMFSMNSATATMSGTMRVRSSETGAAGSGILGAFVMAGLVPAIPIRCAQCLPYRDRRDEPGDDIQPDPTGIVIA